jgi:hypothetical protein
VSVRAIAQTAAVGSAGVIGVITGISTHTISVLDRRAAVKAFQLILGAIHIDFGSMSDEELLRQTTYIESIRRLHLIGGRFDSRACVNATCRDTAISGSDLTFAVPRLGVKTILKAL